MTIKVTVVNPNGRRFYFVRWTDPITGKWKQRSTKTTIRRDADRFAAKLEEEINSGKFINDERITWEKFRERYKAEVSATKRKKTRAKTQSTFNAIETHINPKMLAAIADPNVISQFAAALRPGRSASTVDGHLREVRKLLRWAAKMRLIKVVPHIEFPDFDDEMKGRPITGEEFDRLLKKASERPDLIRPEYLKNWEHALRSLWLSGLRLEESTVLHWKDDSDMAIDLSHKRPMFRIRATVDKGKAFRLLPITPDYADLLLATPQSERKGFVINPYTRGPGRNSKITHRPTANHVGRIISALGEAAGIKVNETKFASAHDFRRSFGCRWCKVVMPKVLQELMRHASIQTTMKYYVGQMAEESAEEVWKAFEARKSDTSSDTTRKTPDSESSNHDSNTTKHDVF